MPGASSLMIRSWCCLGLGSVGAGLVNVKAGQEQPVP